MGQVKAWHRISDMKMFEPFGTVIYEHALPYQNQETCTDVI